MDPKKNLEPRFMQIRARSIVKARAMTQDDPVHFVLNRSGSRWRLSEHVSLCRIVVWPGRRLDLRQNARYSRSH
jgi:hypothetical protein